jgi:DCN1-like protein 1/2
MVVISFFSVSFHQIGFMATKPAPKAKAAAAPPPKVSQKKPDELQKVPSGAVESGKPSAAPPSTVGPASAAPPSSLNTKRTVMDSEFDRLRALDKMAEGMDAIGPRGLQQLCVDIGTPFGDFDMYLLVHKMGATQSFCVTRSEWQYGVHQLKLDHLGQLKSLLPQWKAAILADEAQFTEMYQSMYDFLRSDEDKFLPSEKACAAWQILLPEDRFPLLSLWVQWIALEFKRNITRDIWCQVWEFTKAIKKDLAAYDPNDKWPSALDDFVVWAKAKTAPPKAAENSKQNS